MARIISAAQFGKEQGEYRAVQSMARPILDKATTLPPNARRFYVDSQEESFVFEKELVLELLKQPFAQFLRVYYGAIPAGPPPPGISKPQGSPTIILGAATHYSPYTDIGSLYVEWPDGLDANGNPI